MLTDIRIPCSACGINTIYSVYDPNQWVSDHIVSTKRHQEIAESLDICGLPKSLAFKHPVKAQFIADTIDQYLGPGVDCDKHDELTKRMYSSAMMLIDHIKELEKTLKDSK
jgi:uncharacterized CHY-type Zn-finger protein